MPVLFLRRIWNCPFSPSFQAFWAECKSLEKVPTVICIGEPIRTARVTISSCDMATCASSRHSCDWKKFKKSSRLPRQVQRNSPALLTEAVGKSLQLDGARGEYIHGQVVIVPVKEDLSGVTGSAESLQGSQGATIPLSIRVVGYLDTKEEPEHYEVPFAGWWPDPLLSHLTTFDVPVGACQPLWITVAIPREALPGVYEGQVRVNVGDTKQAVPVRVQVRSFEIPQSLHFRIAARYDGGDWVETVWGGLQ